MRHNKITTKLHWIPVILTGVFVLWFGFRSMALRHAIEGKLEAWGMEAHCGKIRWEGLFDAKIAQLEANFENDGHLDLRQIQLSLSPSLSLQGIDWLQSLSFDTFHFEKNGFLATGSGTWANGIGKLAGRTKFKHVASCNWAMTLSKEKQTQWKSHLLEFRIQDIILDHPKIGKKIKRLHPITGQLRFHKALNTLLKIERGSSIRSRDAFLKLEGEFERTQNTLKLALKVPRQRVQNWLTPINALADSSLQNLQVCGDFSAQYDIVLDLDSLETLQFKGNTNSFALQFEDDGGSGLYSLQTAIAAKEDRISELPSLLPQAVVISEDANFWMHNGFDEAIIQQAIIENIQKRRFVRGAGTIPMQLVRNHCLHQGKQIDRKVSEFVLTWLLEQASPPSKTQELALYLDTIEWGPDIFGIDEAADFYFSKSPKALGLDQIIFLCMIIPNPRQYAKVFDENGQLDGFAIAYFDSIRWILYDMELIDETKLDSPIVLDLEIKMEEKVHNDLI